VVTDDEQRLVAVGRIGPARGVKGDVFVEPWTDFPEERFAAGATLPTEPASAGPLTVVSSSVGAGKLVVHFAGYEDRVAVEHLRGVRLFVPEDARPELDDPDEFYDSDLIGLAARTSGGEAIGPVIEVVHLSGAVYLVLEVGGKERMVPFVAAIVPVVDVAGGTVTVDPPEGLFDL
jgi:16S rRNA processing protein RimM